MEQSCDYDYLEELVFPFMKILIPVNYHLSPRKTTSVTAHDNLTDFRDHTVPNDYTVWSQGHQWLWGPVTRSQPNLGSHDLWPWLRYSSKYCAYRNDHPLIALSAARGTIRITMMVVQPLALACICSYLELVLYTMSIDEIPCPPTLTLIVLELSKLGLQISIRLYIIMWYH